MFACSKDFKFRDVPGNFFVGETVATFVFVLSAKGTSDDMIKVIIRMMVTYVFARIPPWKHSPCLRGILDKRALVVYENSQCRYFLSLSISVLVK